MIDLDTQKKIAEIEKLNADRYKTVSGWLAGLGSAFGVITIFVYCFFIAHFFPTGLKIGDTLLFVFATLGMSLTGMMLSSFGMMAYVPWVNRPTLPASTSPPPGDPADPNAKQKRFANISLLIFAVMALTLTLSIRVLAFKWFELEKLSTAETIWWYILSAISIGIYFCAVYCLIPNWADRATSAVPFLIFALIAGMMGVLFSSGWAAFVFVVGLLLGGFSIVLGLDMLSTRAAETVLELENNRRKRKIASTLILVGILFPYIASGFNATILNFVMKNLGVYTEHATLIVTKSELAKLQTIADAKGIPLYSCRIDDENTAVSDVKIWWHGIGERSYVELNSYTSSKGQDASQRNGVRVELDSAGVRKSESETSTSCIELRRGIYFDSNQSNLTDEQWKLAKPIVTEFFKEKKASDSIVLVGYADPRPRMTDSNFKLAHDRACNVYKFLNASKDTSTQKVLIDIRGDMEAGSTCSSKDGLLRERACEERNRRVEVRLISSNGNEVVRSATANATEMCK